MTTDPAMHAHSLHDDEADLQILKEPFSAGRTGYVFDKEGNLVPVDPEAQKSFENHIRRVSEWLRSQSP